jgi:membrane protease YdiL (CAAX protease family)
MGLGAAAVLPSLAWIGVHGLGAVYGFAGYALLAVLLTGLVLRTKSLVPSMAVHSAIHVFVILGS